MPRITNWYSTLQPSPHLGQANAHTTSPRHKWLMGILAVLMTPLLAHALPTDQDQPVQLEADKATYNEKTGVTTYSGNVIITQGTIKIQADSLVINLDSNRAIKDAYAKGRPATFQQKVSNEKGVAYGEGAQVSYDAKGSLITLTGNALLKHNGASFKGNVLRYNMDAGDVEATGNSQRRVQLIIPPNTSRTPTETRTRP